MTVALTGAHHSFRAFVIVLASFLVIADALIISQIYQRNIAELETSALNEAGLFARLVSQDLTRGDYSSVEHAALNWGSSNTRISSISIITTSGFELAGYAHPTPPTHWKHFDQTITYGDNHSATIHLTVDTSHIRSFLLTLTGQLFLFSLLLALLLGYFLRRVAILPLSKEIDEHLRTEEKLSQIARELKISSQELESYSYTMAHDLRTPLRAIISFTQILKADSADKLSEEDIDHIERIYHAGQHMNALIDDLIELSRISRATLRPANCDVTELATELLSRHKRTDAQREITCKVQPDMHAHGDPKMIERLLSNLIDNAWKYTRKIDKPEIQIGMTEEHGIKHFFVRDNGDGFDMQYADKLFEPFQRLHKSTEFEGTGIGLASARRVVQLHGGEIRGDAEPGKGCTITFSLTPDN